MSKVDVSVVVVNFRTPELAVRSVRDARRSANGLTLEEIVVDNGSGDDSVERLRAGLPEAAIVALEDNRGFAGGTNAGIAAAQGRQLFLVNPDAFCLGPTLGRLSRYLDAHRQAGVVAPALEYEDGTLQNNAYRRFPNVFTVFVDFCLPLAVLVQGRALDPHNLPNTRFDRPRRIAHATGAALLVRREAAAAAGPLDEGFFLYYEETEWQRRISAAGWEVHLEPSARVRHLGGASSDGPVVASPHYIASVERYFTGSPAARRAMMGGAALSLAASRVKGALGRDREAAARQAEAYRSVISRLAA